MTVFPRTLLLLALLALMAALPSRAVAQFVISEFMATNVNTNIEDEDGTHSDWIEIQNIGATSASLNGWYLTDNAGDLRKWQFPVTSPSLVLAPGARLVVWASDKNRKLSADRLHTNFRLDASGEYLALVRPDGLTVEHGYLPKYPPQATDLSYGISGGQEWNVLAGPTLNTQWKVRVPQSASELSSTMAGWNTNAGFNASAWSTKATTVSGGIPKGIGYEAGGSSGSRAFLINYSGSPSGVVASNTDVGASTVGMYISSSNSNYASFTGAPTLCARTTFNVSNPATIQQLRLNIRYDDGFIVYLNGTEVLRVNAPQTVAWNSTAPTDREDDQSESFETFTLAGAQALLQTGTNLLAIHGFNDVRNSGHFVLTPSLEAFQSVAGAGIGIAGYLSSPTPGAENSVASTTVGPDLSQTTQNPPQPIGGSGSAPLLVTTRVRQTRKPVSRVVCRYVINFGAEAALTMKDDGTGGDVTAGDGIYSASVPTTGLAPGHLLRWRIVATDSVSNQSTDPPYRDPYDNDQYFGTMAQIDVQSQLPVLYWFHNSTSAPPVFASNEGGFRSSFFYKLPSETSGRFYDNVRVNLHGQSTAGFAKKSQNVNFNADNRFKWREGEDEIRGMNLLSNWADKTHVRNSMAWETWNLTEHPSHWCQPVRVQQVTNNSTSLNASVEAQFLAVMDMVEDANKEFMERWGLDHLGALYKCYNALDNTLQNSPTQGGGVEKKTREWEDFSDLQALVTAMNPSNGTTARRQWLYDNVDIPALINYLAVHNLIQSHDFGHKNYYIYRDTNGSGEWKLLPWDQDLSFGHRYTSAQGYFDDDIESANSIFIGGGGNRLMNIVTASGATELAQMYVRRLRTLMDQFYGPPAAPVDHFPSRIDAYLDLLDPPGWPVTTDAELDFQKWGFWVDGSGTKILPTDSRAVHHRIRPSAVRVKSFNDTSIYPGANPYSGFGGTVNVHSSLNPFVPGRRSFLYGAISGVTPSTNGQTIPAAQPATPSLLIEDVNYNPGTAGQDQEYFVIRNPHTVAIDISGWTISGAIDYTFPPGTVIPGAGTSTSDGSSGSYVNQLIVARKAKAFRSRTASPRGSEFRLVVGGYDGRLSARGGRLELRDTNGVLIRGVNYQGAPTPAQNNLRITELHYAPAPPTSAQSAALPGVQASDFEFVELLNNGTSTLDLGGAQFDRGITYVFPAGFTLAPGARTLIVSNLAAFILRYGSGFNVAGQYEGNLSNSGEQLRLLDNVGEIVLDFTYDPSWYTPARTGGHSLIAINHKATYSTYGTAENWRTSISISGSPGTDEPPFVTTLEAVNVTATSVTLRAQVNPNGTATTPEFVIWDTRYTAEALPEGNAAVIVEKEVTGLLPHTEYTFRAEATNAVGPNVGAELTFTTLNRAPEATDRELHLPLHALFGIDVLSSASDPDDDDLFITAVTPAQHGTVQITQNGTRLLYIPGATYAGNDSFTYTVSDGFGGTDSATLTLVNSQPNAANTQFHLPTQTEIIIDVLASASDSDNDELTITDVTQAPLGAIAISQDGKKLRYFPGPVYTGNDTFSYTIRDGFGGSATATVSLINSHPVALNKQLHFAVRTPFEIEALTSDSDPDSDGLTIVTVASAQHGTVEITMGGKKLLYTPGAEYTGNDSFTYTVSDGFGGSSSAIVTLINAAPVAVADSITTTGEPVTFDPRDNDTDGDGDTISVTAVTQGSVGSVTISDTGTLTYTPSPEFFGRDFFTYTVTDGSGASSSASVSVRSTVPVVLANPEKGAQVPGEETGAVYASLGIPKPGAFLGAVKHGKLQQRAIFAADGTVLLKVGDAAPGIANATIATLGEPSGQAVVATLKGSSKAAGITRANDTVLYVGLGGGDVRIAAREGEQVATGAKLQSFLSIDGNGETVFFRAKLAGPAVKAANDIALGAVPADSPLRILAREGDLVGGQPITSIGTLTAAAGTLAEGRWRVGADAIGVRLSFPRKQQALYTIPADALTSEQWTPWGATDDIYPGAGKLQSFGLPGFGPDGVAYVARLFRGAPSSPEKVTASNDSALIHVTEDESTLVARKGGPVPGLEGEPLAQLTFRTFADPVAGAGKRMAFAGTVAGSGVTAANRSGLWVRDGDGSVRMLARAGELAPGGGRWASFESLVLPDGPQSGPLFIGKLMTKGADKVDAKSNRGLWAVGSDETLHLLLRTNQPLTVNDSTRTIKNFVALAPARGSFGSASGYDDHQQVSALVTFTNGTQALVHIFIP